MAVPGDVVGDRYRLIRQLGAGGMGVVWEARDERMDRLVAIKQLRSQPGLPPQETAVAGERAMREARITARLHHPHAVAVFDVVEQDGSPCIVMELVPSVPLTETLRTREVITPAETARIGSQIAGALAAAHALGIVHRDVKPGNVLMGQDGTARICDFGISRAYGDSTLTMTGMITGTPAYLAPEVARGDDSTPASDVYSLGATLYAAVEGRPPSGTEGTPIAVLYRVAAGQVNPPERAGALAPLLLQMLDADPARRPSMASVSTQLSSTTGSASTPASMPGARTEPTRVLPHPPTGPAPVPGPAAAPPAGTTVQRPAVTSPPPPAPPVTPSTPSTPATTRRRRLGPALLIAAVVLLLLGGFAALRLWNQDAQLAAEPSAGTTGSQPAEPEPSNSPSRSEATSAPPASSPAPAPSTPTSTGTSPTTGANDAQLVAAVTDYYALLPDDTDAAWQRLTAAYQGQTGGRNGYEGFWKEIDTVTVSGVRVSEPGQVQATVSYVAKSGNQKSTERRSFQLVAEGGQLKINQSAVL